jgi:hypothetical protein
MLQLLYPFLVSAADRIRGGLLSDYGVKIPGKLLTAVHSWTIALAIGHGFDVAGLWLVLALTIGEAMGWGHPLGWALTGAEKGAPERYEIGPLAKNPWLSLAARGLIWAILTTPVALIYDTTILNLLWIMPLTMTVAPWIAVRTSKLLPNTWGAQEFYRGFLTGTLAVLSAYLT